MKRHRVRGFVIVSLIALMPAFAEALDHRDLTFYAPFDGTFEPLIARGSPQPSFGAKKPTFGDGVIGKALIAGDVDVGLSYAVKDNLDDMSATIAMWMKPLDWERTDGRNHWYLRIGGRMSLYWYGASAWTNFYWMKGGSLAWGMGGYPGGALKKDEWTHVAFTWGDGRCVFYYDGKFLKHKDGTPSGFTRWAEGNARFSFADDGGRTAYDEFMIFNRPLSAVEVMSLYRRSGRALPTPTVRIPKQRRAPRIDGKVKSHEWRDSAGITGFLDRPFGNLIRKDMRARLSYDEANLFIMVESEKSISRKASSVEIWIAPDENAAAEKRLYFYASPDGTKVLTSGKGGEIKKKWMASFGVQGQMEIAELAIPFATIGIDPSSAKGLCLNIARGWSKEFGDWASWVDAACIPDAKTNPARFGRVLFAGEAPVLALDSFGEVYYAKLDMRGESINPKVATQTIKMTVRLQPTDLRELVGPEHGLMVGQKTWSGTIVTADRIIEAKGGITEAAIAQEFHDTDINSVLVRAEDACGNLLYEQQAPFVCTPPMLLEAKTYPKHGRVDVIADVSAYREAPPEELSAEVVFYHRGEEVGRISIDRLATKPTTVSFELEKLPEGEIIIRAPLKGADGKILFTGETKFTKFAPGPWVNNKLGLDDKVIAPFEPIRVDGQSVSVWNRTYVWKDSLFPVEIHTGGVQVLSAPIELYTGKAPSGKANNATVTVKSKSDTTVTLEAKGDIEGVSVTAKTLIEYDGMIFINMMLEAASARKLPRLALVVPMKSEYAWLYHGFARAGAVSETENFVRAMKGDEAMPWRGAMWLGTPEEGLTWFNTAPKNWKLKDDAKPIHIRRNGDTTSLTLTFAASAFDVQKPKKISFGFIATPVKRMRDNWRFFRCGRDWSYSWFIPMMNSNNHITKMEPGFPEYMKKIHEKVPLHVCYVRPDWMNLAEPQLPYYREEWVRTPWRINGTDAGGIEGENKHIEVCLESDWQDFLLYHMMKIIDAADGDGFYFDGIDADLSTCTNRNHGHGYFDEDGILQPERHVFGSRRLLKRLAVEMDKRKDNWQDYLIWVHSYNHNYMPVYSFASLGWDGEQHGNASRLRDYTKVMTAEQFVAEFHGKQLGMPIQLLGNFHDRKGQPPIREREMDTAICLGLITGTQELAIGAAVWAHKDNSVYQITVADMADEFGLSKGRARFIGWWHNEKYIEQAPPNNKLKCSLWKGDGKVLVMLGNANGDKTAPATTTITLKKEALGLSGAIKATDLSVEKIVSRDDNVTYKPVREAVPMKDNSFTVTVEGSSWRMIAIEPAE